MADIASSVIVGAGTGIVIAVGGYVKNIKEEKIDVGKAAVTLIICVAAGAILGALGQTDTMIIGVVGYLTNNVWSLFQKAKVPATS